MTSSFLICCGMCGFVHSSCPMVIVAMTEWARWRHSRWSRDWLFSIGPCSWQQTRSAKYLLPLSRKEIGEPFSSKRHILVNLIDVKICHLISFVLISYSSLTQKFLWYALTEHDIQHPNGFIAIWVYNIIQKRIAKLLSGKQKYPSHGSFKELDMLSIYDKNKGSLGMFCYKFNFGLLPGEFDNFFTKVSITFIDIIQDLRINSMFQHRVLFMWINP